MWRRQRCVALDIDHDVRLIVQILKTFRATLRPVSRVFGRHHHVRPERFRGIGNASVVGQDVHGTDTRNLAGPPPSFFGSGVAHRRSRP